MTRLRVVGRFRVRRESPTEPFMFLSTLNTTGGFVDYGEDPEKAVVRELEEETHLKMRAGARPLLVAVHGDPNRDPRQHIVTIGYAVPIDLTSLKDLRGDDDAKEAAWFSLTQLRDQTVLDTSGQPVRLAFDHQKLLDRFYSWLFDETLGGIHQLRSL